MSKLLFNGKILREPRAATQLRIGVPPTVNPEATNRVLVIGPSAGGLPVADGKVYTFSNVSEAAAVLRSGDALRAIGFIFNPSPSFSGAAEVDFIRMDQATAGSWLLTDGSDTAVTLTSVDKGIWVNKIQVTVTGASSTRTITVKVPDPQIQGGTDAVVAGAVVTSITAKFMSRGAKVGDYLYLSNSSAGQQIYTIQSVDSETQVTLTASASSGSGVSWSHFVYGRTQVSDNLSSNTDIVNWVAANASDVLIAVAGTAVLPVAVTRNLSGGSVSAGGTNEITAALLLARNLDIQHIFVARACGSAGDELEFSGLVRGHILNDAEVPARGYLGSGLGTTSTNAITYAGLLNSAKLVYCYQTILDTTLDGLSTEQLSGFMLAAKVCGLAAGLPPQTPLTRKAIDIRGIVAPTGDAGLDRSKREKLLKGGVCHVFQQPGTTSFVVNQGITTIQKQDYLWDATTASSPEISLNRIAESLLYNMQKSADTLFVGTTASLGKAVVENFARSYLEGERGNLITDWRSLVVTQVADKWQIEFGFVPNNPINYVLIVGTVIG